MEDLIAKPVKPPLSRRSLFQSAFATAGALALNSIPLPTQAFEREAPGSLLDRIEIFRNEPLFNPPLYQGADYLQAGLDITQDTFRDPYRIAIGSMYFLLNHPFTKKEPHTQPGINLIQAISQSAETILSIAGDQNSWETGTRALLSRFCYYLRLFVISWVKDQKNPVQYPDQIADLNNLANKFLMFYQLSDNEAKAIRKQSQAEFQDLIDRDVIVPDSLSELVLNLTDFTDRKGDIALDLLIKKIIQRSSHNPIPAKSAELLRKAWDEDEFDTFIGIATFYSSPKVWVSIDSERLEKQTDQNHRFSAFIGGLKMINKRKSIWLEYDQVNREPNTHLISREFNGIDIFGEDQPLEEKALRALFIQSASPLFDQSIPSFQEIGKNRKEKLSDNIRYYEYMVTASAWEGFKKQLVKYNLSPEEWLLMHNIEFNQMLAAASPQTTIRTAIKRIVIVADQTITERAERFEKTGTGSNRTSYFFPGPEHDCYTQVDSISPWSLDIQGRWFLENSFNIDGLPYRTPALTDSDGQDIPLDIGMVHEIAHQLLGMADYYQYNTIDKKIFWEGKSSQHIPKDFKKFIFARDTGVDLPMGMNGRPFYPWIETAYLEWLRVKQPAYFKTFYRPYLSYPEERPGYDPLKAKSLKISFTSEGFDTPRQAMLLPMRLDDDFAVKAEVNQNELIFSARQLIEQSLHPDKGGFNLLLELDLARDKKYFLPIPGFLINALYLLSDLSERPMMETEVRFFKSPYAKNNYTHLDHFQIRFVTEEEYDSTYEKHNQSIYAQMKTSYKGQNYYVVWTEQKKSTPN